MLRHLKVLRKPKEPIIVGDKLICQIGLAPTLIIVSGKHVAQGKAEMEYLRHSCFVGAAGTGQLLHEPGATISHRDAGGVGPLVFSGMELAFVPASEANFPTGITIVGGGGGGGHTTKTP